MKKYLKLLALLPLVCGLLVTSACSDKDKNSDNPFVGTWKTTAYLPSYLQVTFNADKTYQSVVQDGEYTYRSNGTYSYSESAKTLTVVDVREAEQEVLSYHFISATTLRLTDEEGRSETYYKQ